MKKLFIVNKFIEASCAEEAIRLEARQKPDEVFLDPDWKKGTINMASSTLWYKGSKKKNEGKSLQ